MEIYEFFFSGFLHWECSISAESMQKLLHVCLCQVQTKEVSTFLSVTQEVCLISIYRLDLSKHNQKKSDSLGRGTCCQSSNTHKRVFFDISTVRVPAFPAIGPDTLLQNSREALAASGWWEQPPYTALSSLCTNFAFCHCFSLQRRKGAV